MLSFVNRKLGLILDMDGVVCHNMPAHEEAWRRFLRSHAIEMDLQDFRENTVGMTTGEVLRYYFKRDVSPEEAACHAQVKEKTYRDIYRSKRRAAQGLRRFLAAANRAGWRVGLGTGSKGDGVAFIIDHLKLRRYFDTIVDGSQVTKGKPNPETFLRVARKLKVPAKDCIVFEDALLGEKAARRARMTVIAVTTSLPAKKFRSAALAVRDFRGLTPEKLLMRLRVNLRKSHIRNTSQR